MRLERYDSYLTTFHARVTEVRRDARGDWLRLDRSAFYPDAGGQLHDTGSLVASGLEYAVTDVQVDSGEAVWHLVVPRGAGAPAPTPGSEVLGAIDWVRRFRHMQRHSAQHLLSAALVKLDTAFGTLSVSMRGPDCTIEVGGEFAAEHLSALDAEADRAARRNLPITAFEVDESRLSDYALRRPAKVGGTVRLVAIAQYDIVACGGTHLRSTAEALPIKVLGFERVRGGNTRITFRAGEEALLDLNAKHDAAVSLGRAFSAPVHELPGRAERLQADLLEARGEANAWRRRVAERLVEERLAARPGGPLVAVLEGEDARLLADLTDACQRREGLVAFLAAVAEGQAQLAFVAGPEVDMDVRPHLAATLADLGGRGGGRPDRAQGAAPATAVAVAAALDRAAAALTRT